MRVPPHHDHPDQSIVITKIMIVITRIMIVIIRITHRDHGGSILPSGGMAAGS
jgi:hypothetical protein